MDKLLDLRFVIGAFFAIVGILLTAYGGLSAEQGRSINLWCGISFIIFGVAMIVLSLKKDAGDELG